jgi:hypothetical protein
MRKLLVSLAASMPVLAGCNWAPPIQVERSGSGRRIAIQNVGDHVVRVERIVANSGHGDENCIDRTARPLAPGEIYETTFFICGPVDSVEVETDEGVASHTFPSDEPVP